MGVYPQQMALLLEEVFKLGSEEWKDSSQIHKKKNSIRLQCLSDIGVNALWKADIFLLDSSTF